MDNFIPSFIEENSSSDKITSGIFANAHPVATVRSAFLTDHCKGAVPFDFIE